MVQTLIVLDDIYKRMPRDQWPKPQGR